MKINPSIMEMNPSIMRITPSIMGVTPSIMGVTPSVVSRGLWTSLRCTFSIHMHMPHALKQYILFHESCFYTYFLYKNINNPTYHFLDNLHNLNLQLILTLKLRIIFTLQNIIIISIYSKVFKSSKTVRNQHTVGSGL
jgi:hypothetical protein